MIKRERYMSRIRPFMGNDLIKVLTGIRRSGKSVMLDLIKEELISSGISDTQFTINFEAMKNARLCTAEALYREIIQQAEGIHSKIYLFLVTYLLVSEDTIHREFGVYDTISDNFPKYVVSMDEFDMSRNGIKHRNIREFLLAENWE